MVRLCFLFFSPCVNSISLDVYAQLTDSRQHWFMHALGVCLEVDIWSLWIGGGWIAYGWRRICQYLLPYVWDRFGVKQKCHPHAVTHRTAGTTCAGDFYVCMCVPQACLLETLWSPTAFLLLTLPLVRFNIHSSHYLPLLCLTFIL